MENMSTMSTCSEEPSQDLKTIEPKQEVQAEDDVLSANEYRTCLVSVPDVFDIAEAIE
jgi:hypothetical protein